MKMPALNKCKCGRYKPKSSEFCVFCDPNPEKIEEFTCSICKIKKLKKDFYSDTICRDCVKKIRLENKRVCRYCGFIGKEEDFHTRFRCIKCFKKDSVERTRNYRESLKGELLKCRICGLTKDGSKFESRFLCCACVAKKRKEEFKKIDTDLTCKKCGCVGKNFFFSSRNVCKKCFNEAYTKKRHLKSKLKKSKKRLKT